MKSLLPLLPLGLAVVLVAGCGSPSFFLPGHQDSRANTSFTLHPGERRLALETPARLPAPGGYEIALASENPAIVSVERIAGSAGSARFFLVAHTAGSAALHYVNGYAAPLNATTPEAAADLRERYGRGFNVVVR